MLMKCVIIISEYNLVTSHSERGHCKAGGDGLGAWHLDDVINLYSAHGNILMVPFPCFPAQDFKH
jgi:hypothetical protein